MQPIRLTRKDIWTNGSYDAVIPVIHGIPLSEIVGGRFAGLHANVALPPSRQWLGAPTYEEDGFAVILDGGCGHAGCCGVFARVELGTDEVRWGGFWARGVPNIPQGLSFTFDRKTYEEALALAGMSTPEREFIDFADGG